MAEANVVPAPSRQARWSPHRHPALPLTPLPLVTAMTSMTSLWLNTLCTGTCFSSRAWAQATFSATVPPFSWISMMWAFFCRKGSSFIWQMRHASWFPESHTHPPSVDMAWPAGDPGRPLCTRSFNR